MLCQATRSEPATVTLPSQSPDGPYRLCEDAAERLQLRALRPLEWFNLAVVHGPDEHELHDDFYTEKGEACQPYCDVVDAELFPCPSLKDCAGDLSTLIDFAITQMLLKPRVTRCFRPYRGHLLDAIRDRSAQTKNVCIQLTLAQVAGEVLGPTSAEWFQQALARFSIEDRLLLLHSGRKCVAPTVGIELCERALAELPVKRLAHECRIFAPYQDASVLDWIEANISDPLVDSWGDVAAASQLDWGRAQRWLSGGRPLSLVALDALVVFVMPPADWRLRRMDPQPRMAHVPPADVMEAAHTAYAKLDPVPRVECAVEFIIASLAATSSDGSDRGNDSDQP